MKSSVAVLLRYLEDTEFVLARLYFFLTKFGASVYFFLAYSPAIKWVLAEDEGAMPQGKE
jgi:hypothetical protein